MGLFCSNLVSFAHDFNEGKRNGRPCVMALHSDVALLKSEAVGLSAHVSCLRWLQGFNERTVEFKGAVDSRYCKNHSY